METKQRIMMADRAHRKATLRLLALFVLLFGGSMLCFWGWVLMLKAVL